MLERVAPLVGRTPVDVRKVRADAPLKCLGVCLRRADEYNLRHESP
jgi:hypothetical protein